MKLSTSKEQEERFSTRLEEERTARRAAQEQAALASGGKSKLDDSGLGGAQNRIKELHRVIAEHEQTIRELRDQADENIDRINVIRTNYNLIQYSQNENLYRSEPNFI